MTYQYMTLPMLISMAINCPHTSRSINIVCNKLYHCQSLWLWHHIMPSPHHLTIHCHYWTNEAPPREVGRQRCHKTWQSTVYSHTGMVYSIWIVSISFMQWSCWIIHYPKVTPKDTVHYSYTKIEIKQIIHYYKLQVIICPTQQRYHLTTQWKFFLITKSE